MHNYETPAAVMQQAVEALKAGNLALAQVLAWICIEQEPEHADAYNLLGVIACQLKLFEQGVRFLERALQISPDHKSAKANYNRARTELSVHAAKTVRGGAEDAKPRYHVIQSWGTGFWSDVLHVVGQLLVTDATGRQPVVHWGGNSNFNKHPPTDCFVDFFEPVSDIGVEELLNAGLEIYPPIWTDAEILEGKRNQNRTAGFPCSAVDFLSRDEAVTVADHFSDIGWIRHWIPLNHPMAGLTTIETIRRCMKRWIRPRASLQDRVRAFCSNELRGQPFIAFHLRGTDKFTENPSLEGYYAPLFARVEKLASANPDTPIFAMTDSETLVEMICERFGSQVVIMDVIRSRTEMGIHWRQQGFDPRRIGEEILVESLVASSAQIFVGIGTSTVPCMIECLKDWPPGACQIFGNRITELLNDYIYR